MNRDDITCSIAKMILEEEYTSPIECYNHWRSTKGMLVNDFATASWILDTINDLLQTDKTLLSDFLIG